MVGEQPLHREIRAGAICLDERLVVDRREMMRSGGSKNWRPKNDFCTPIVNKEEYCDWFGREMFNDKSPTTRNGTMFRHHGILGWFGSCSIRQKCDRQVAR